MLFVFLISFLVMMVVYILFYFISLKKQNEMEKVSAYECGFDGGSSSRMMFSYRFFLISILFLVFDVEIILLIPFTFFMKGLSETFFILILLLGLVYELIYGSLDWL